MQKRRSPRITKRLEVKFTASDTSITGITSNLSSEGIFVRTKKGFHPGVSLDIELYLPSGETIHLKGRVKRTIKTQLQSVKNGMGIELTDIPQKYKEYIKSLQ